MTISAIVTIPKRFDNNHVKELEMVWKPKRVSWGFDVGFARLTLEKHVEAGWLQLQAEEHGKSSRKVCLTLSKDDVVKLLEFLS